MLSAIGVVGVASAPNALEAVRDLGDNAIRADLGAVAAHRTSGAVGVQNTRAVLVKLNLKFNMHN